jgi:hypothetical protein
VPGSVLVKATFTANTINPKLTMPNTLIPKAIMPVTRVRTAIEIFKAAWLLPLTGVWAKDTAILLVSKYIIKAITPAIAEPLRQRNGLGRGSSGVSAGMGSFPMIKLNSKICGGNSGLSYVAKNSRVFDNAKGVN